MKRIKFKQKQSRNRNWQKFLGLICILGVVLSSIIFLTRSFQEKEQVSAHPTSIIELGSGDTKFKVPIDATQLEEQAIEDLAPQFDAYVQGNDRVPVLNKENISAYGSEQARNGADIGVSVKSIEETENGNYFVLFQISGSGVGGITRTAVYDKEGNELASNSIGTRHNVNLRVGTKIYNRAGNTFLVTTFNNTWFRYTVNDSSNPVTIDRYQYPSGAITGNPNTALQIDTHGIIDQFSSYSNDALIIGRSYPGHTSSQGVYKKRISVGAVNTSGWKTTGFNSNSIYQYTLENLLMYEELGLNESQGSNVCSMSGGEIFKFNNYMFGPFGYVGYQQGVQKIVQTFQIFDTTINTQERGDINPGMANPVLKKRIYQHRTIEQIKNDIAANNSYYYRVIKSMCDDDYVYFTVENQLETQLVRVDLNTYTDQIVKIYPRNTNINFFENVDGSFSYYGTTTSLTGEFASDYYSANPTVGSHFFISGTANGINGETDDLDIKSLRAFEVNGLISADYALEGENNNIFVAGVTNDVDTFPNQKFTIEEDSHGIYLNPSGTPSSSCGYIGMLTINDDYAPVIRSDNSILVDITDQAITNPTSSGYKAWSTLDRWLITGSRNGDVADANAIKVYDHFDNNDSLIGATPQLREEWLQKRINRNPRAPDRAIEWEKLGFNDQESGPQLVTYFVTDSQSQPAVTSRWVNAKGPQTVTDEDNKYALDAQNFHIPLNGINAAIADDNKFKEFAKTLAWSLTNNEASSGEHGNGVDEDGASKDSSSAQDKLSTKVTVDSSQLAALKNATVAKPYPVDVTYKPGDGTEITNRVWVFVTTDNTVPNTETSITPVDTKGVVIYADDYSLPYRMRLDQDLDAVLASGNVKAYNYYAKDRTAELAPLPDSTNNQSNWSITDLGSIHDPFSGGTIDLPTTVRPELNYEWSEASDFYHTQGDITKGSLDVTLTGNVLLHVRQVVKEPNNELVVPTEGYVSIHNTLNNNGVPTLDPKYELQVVITSGKQTDNPNFSDFGLDLEHLTDGLDQVNLTLNIPEFYKYNGYYVSSEKASHSNDSLNAPNNTVLTQNALYDQGEFWITFYIEPNGINNGNPQLYSWDYKKNDLGKIKTK